MPSGVWAFDEYEKLRRYDRPTPEQPTVPFSCHQNDRDSDTGRLCAGWVGCHDTGELLALRTAVIRGTIEGSTARSCFTYTTPVPLFASGNEAADHGQANIDTPNPDARRVVTKIFTVRSDLKLSD